MEPWFSIVLIMFVVAALIEWVYNYFETKSYIWVCDEWMKKRGKRFKEARDLYKEFENVYDISDLPISSVLKRTLGYATDRYELVESTVQSCTISQDGEYFAPASAILYVHVMGKLEFDGYQKDSTISVTCHLNFVIDRVNLAAIITADY